jgi:hypothetical protein
MHRPAHPPRPGLDQAYGEVALSAVASIDAEQAREFANAELGPLTAADDDTVRLSTTLRVYLKENIRPSVLAATRRTRQHDHEPHARRAQEPPPHPIELQVALIRLAHDG